MDPLNTLTKQMQELPNLFSLMTPSMQLEALELLKETTAHIEGTHTGLISSQNSSCVEHVSNHSSGQHDSNPLLLQSSDDYNGQISQEYSEVSQQIYQEYEVVTDNYENVNLTSTADFTIFNQPTQVEETIVYSAPAITGYPKTISIVDPCGNEKLATIQEDGSVLVMTNHDEDYAATLSIIDNQCTVNSPSTDHSYLQTNVNSEISEDKESQELQGMAKPKKKSVSYKRKNKVLDKNVPATMNECPLKRKRGRPRKEKVKVTPKKQKRVKKEKVEKKKEKVEKKKEKVEKKPKPKPQKIPKPIKPPKVPKIKAEKDPVKILDMSTCKLCDKVFNNPSNRKVHMRSHNGLRPHTCESCGDKFTTRQNLFRHISIHTGEKLYDCNICEKKFREKKTLVQHLRTHTGERPFSCEICQKRFTQRSSLDSHISVHQGIKKHLCDFCGSSFLHRSSLLVHKRRHILDKMSKQVKSKQSRKKQEGNEKFNATEESIAVRALMEHDVKLEDSSWLQSDSFENVPLVQSNTSTNTLKSEMGPVVNTSSVEQSKIITSSKSLTSNVIVITSEQLKLIQSGIMPKDQNGIPILTIGDLPKRLMRGTL